MYNNKLKENIDVQFYFFIFYGLIFALFFLQIFILLDIEKTTAIREYKVTFSNAFFIKLDAERYYNFSYIISQS